MQMNDTKTLLSDSSPANDIRRDWSDWLYQPRFPIAIVIVILFSLALVMFGDVLFTGNSIVLSQANTDISLHFFFWKQFAITQLQQGNFPLWNPYIFSGTHIGLFETGWLNPINIIYLVLSLSKAINWDFALNIFLSGFFTYLWLSHRRLHPLASLVAAILSMFSSARFLHIFPGHLDVVAAMTWTPLIFLAIDGIITSHPSTANNVLPTANFRPSSWVWVFLGIFAIAMQLFAGHPQTFFYTAIAGGIYIGLNLIKNREKLKLLGQVGLIYLGGIALAAIQLLTGIQTAEESVRSGGMTYDLGSNFSFPPENLITLLAPKFFGNETTVPYWGRYFMWEMVLFIGVTGLFLAIYGIIYGDKKQRRFAGIMTLILLLFALGSNTYFYQILYHWLPGLNRFRGPSKFIFQASQFLVLLAGIGFSQIIADSGFLIPQSSTPLETRGKSSILTRFTGPKSTSPHWRKVAVGALTAAVILMIVALFIHLGAAAATPNWWQHLVSSISNTHQSYLPTAAYQDQKYIEFAGNYAGNTLLIAAAILFFIALILVFIKPAGLKIMIIGLLAITEIIVFARSSRPTFNISTLKYPELERIKQLDPNDSESRILNIPKPNATMVVGMYNIWGNQPLVLRRYAEYIAYSQGQNPDQVTHQIKFTRFNKFLYPLRGRYILVSDEKPIQYLELNKDKVLSRALLIQRVQVLKNRDDIFKMISSPEFNPKLEVILEQEPNTSVADLKSRPGTIQIKDISTDELELDAELISPAILVITDSYSKGWRATALPGSSQSKYQVIPADYILRGIPLTAGHHRFRLRYLPIGFLIGKWISIISGIIYLILLGIYFRTVVLSSKSKVRSLKA
jgi:hypothetical protein